MKEDFCVRCGSENLKDVEKEIEIPLSNPSKIIVTQECNECQDCGEIYLNKKQIEKLSKKINEKDNNI